jgi:hypothetical protein
MAMKKRLTYVFRKVIHETVHTVVDTKSKKYKDALEEAGGDADFALEIAFANSDTITTNVDITEEEIVSTLLENVR